jgi:hypothetical protein
MAGSSRASCLIMIETLDADAALGVADNFFDAHLGVGQKRNGGRRDLAVVREGLHTRHRNILTGRTEAVVRCAAEAVVRLDLEVKRRAARLTRDTSAVELLHLLVGIGISRESAVVGVALGLVGGECMRRGRGENHRSD